MEVYLVILHDAGYDPEVRVFRSRQEAEKWLYEWTIEAIGGDEYFDEFPEKREEFQDPNVIYKLDYNWGENDAWMVFLIRIDVEGTEAEVLIPCLD